jgi:hypothetical protein
MSITKTYIVRSLRDFREKLLEIKKEDLSYKTLEQWLVVNRSATDLVLVNHGPALYNEIIRHLVGHQNNTDVDVLDEVRHEFVPLIDAAILQMDSQEIVRPVLDELVSRVTDTKLSTLLNELNAIKNAQPNFAAIGFRTILCWVIHERAKRVAPDSELAKKEDFSLEPMIRAASANKLSGSAELKLVECFLRGGQKDIFDNVAHKPGSNALVVKDDLSAAVETLNKLLPTLL